MQVAQLEQDRQTVDRQRVELEEGYAANISTQSTVQKAARNLVRACVCGPTVAVCRVMPAVVVFGVCGGRGERKRVFW